VTDIKELLGRLLGGATLGEAEAEAAFEALLTGQFTEAQIASFLTLIQGREATVEELVGAARVMRRHVTRVPVPDDPRASVIDTCCTGGAPKTFNISTVAGIVAAAASPHHGRPSEAVRVLVAKHGNRSRTGRGSAEVLAALGVNVGAPPEVQGRCLEEAGVCFCFAIRHHPAAKHAAPTRQALGFPTMFNLLGPLTNPAGAPRQLMGIYRPELVEQMARVLARLGSVRAMVVHGEDGLDEITLTGRTLAAHVENGRVRAEHIDPKSLGLGTCTLDDLRVHDLDECAALIRRILDPGRSPKQGPRRDVVLLNAAASLLVAGAASDLPEGLSMAAAAVDSGRAAQTLDKLREVSNA
jgi:anthranilate phosphoribosyltransferase